MNVSRTEVGITAGHAGQPPATVHEYTLDAGPALCVRVWTYGATLVEARVPDRNGRSRNVTLRLPDLAAYEDRRRNPYLGATLGRFARCVAQGRLRLGDREHRLDRNIGPHHFHGGSIGFDRYVWSAEAGREGDELVLRLRLESPDGDQGYPGRLSAEAAYGVRADGRLSFRYRASATRSTIVGLTNHAYWNLAGEGRIDGHTLSVNAGRVVGANEELIPRGPLLETARTELDFRTPRPLGAIPLDHCFVLDGPAKAAELHDLRSGRFLTVRTDQPGLAVHTADSFETPRAGICLQTGALPDAPNRPDFPSARLEPGECHHHETLHEFSVR